MKRTFLILALVGSVALSSCGGKQQTEVESASDIVIDKALYAEALQYFKALPEVAASVENPITGIKKQLGKTLFYDNRLSKNNTQSCNTCHNLNTFGVDNEATSAGDLGKRGDRNSPTVYNAALHTTQFWDGRAKDVEEQAGMPITNPVEMNMPSDKFVEDKLKGIEGYRKLFAQAFPDEKEPITYANLRKAIASFERTLITPNRFNEYLKGNLTALNNEEQKGLKEFISVGCVSCHSGVVLGGTMFQKFPVYGADYKAVTGSTHDDLGKMSVSKLETDKYVFKVPSLLNIAKTAPYFHDGSVADLDKAIAIMAKLQLNKELTAEQIKSIKIFLESLTGTLPVSATIAPTMP